MIKMRKPISIMVITLIAAISLTACGGGSSTPEES
jgi:predicted small secreted protein